MRWARVSIRSTGSVSTAAFTEVDETSVVDGVVQVVGRRRGTGVQAEHEVDHEGLSLASLEVEDAVVAEALDARIGSSSVTSSCSCPRLGRPRHHPEGVHAGTHVVDPETPHPPRGQQGGQRDVGVLALVDRPRARRRRPAARPGSACGWPRPGAAGPAPASCVEPAQQLPSSARRSWRSRAPGRARSGRSGDAGRHRRVDPLGELVADVADHAAGAVVHRELLHPVAVRPPVHRDVRHVVRRHDAAGCRGRPGRRRRR